MEISTDTANVLKNFANINSNIIIRPGNCIMTMSEAKNVLGLAMVAETFDKEVGIYDLHEFLNAFALVDRPSVRFDDKYMLIGGNSGRTMIKYYYSDPDMLTSPTKPITMPSTEVTFWLDQGTLASLKRAASVFGHSQLAIEPNNGSIKLSVVDPDNSTANEFSIDVDGVYGDNASFKFILNISNLKMIPDDYHVAISSQLISEFSTSEGNLKYWVALEKSSTYGE